LNVFENNSDVSSTAQSISTQTLPVALNEAILGTGVDANGLIVLTNNTGDVIRDVRVLIDGKDHNYFGINLPQGNKVTFKLDSLSVPCSSGQDKIIKTVTIIYTTRTGLEKTQKMENISLQCAQTPSPVATINPIQENQQGESTTLDTQGPVISIESPGDEETFNIGDDIQFEYLASDQSGVQDCNLIINGNSEDYSYTIDGENLNYFVYPTSELSANDYTISIFCRDNQNNSSSATQRTFTLINPVLTSLSNPNFETGDLSGWTVEDNSGPSFTMHGHNVDGGSTPAEGDYSIGSFSGSDLHTGEIYSEVFVIPEEYVYMTFYYSGGFPAGYNHCETTPDTHFGWDNECDGSIDVEFEPEEEYNADIWRQGSINIIDYAGTSGCVRAIDNDTEGCGWIGFDDIEFTTVPPVHQLRNGLIGYWTMDETTSDMTDHSANNTVATKGSLVVVGESGKMGNGYQFNNSTNGSTNAIILPNDLINLEDTRSISFWFKSSNIDASNSHPGRGLYYLGQTGFDGSQMFVLSKASPCAASDGYINFYSRRIGGANVCTGQIAYTNGEWMHVVITSGSTTTKIYINGQLKVTGTQSFINTTNTSHTFGLDPRHGRSALYESFDELAMWNRVISAEEVSAIYRSGNGLSLDH
jgi:hypothetical protein